MDSRRNAMRSCPEGDLIHKAAREATKNAAEHSGTSGLAPTETMEDKLPANSTQPPKAPPLPHIKAGDMVFENAQLLI